MDWARCAVVMVLSFGLEHWFAQKNVLGRAPPVPVSMSMYFVMSACTFKAIPPAGRLGSSISSSALALAGHVITVRVLRRGNRKAPPTSPDHVRNVWKDSGFLLVRPRHVTV